MILRIKNFILGSVLLFSFSGLTSCKPASNVHNDSIIKVQIDNGPLELLVPNGCIGSSWLYKRRVTPGMLTSHGRNEINAPASSSQINTELMIAVADYFGDNYSEIKRLLNSNVDVNETNYSGCTALIWAIVFKRKDFVSLLIDEGANIEQPDTKGTTPLMFAALAKDENILRKLLASGANVNASQTGGKNEIGTTALHHAVTRKDNYTTIKLLIEHGANVTSADETGRTALMKAAWWGDVAHIRLLLGAGADLERRSNIGQTALHESISTSANVPIIRLLISKGANVKTADKWGKTPLMDAANWGHIEVVKLLVEAGADVERKSNEGQTALDFARSRKRTNVVTYLESLN